MTQLQNHIKWEKDHDNIVTLTMDVQGHGVNTLNQSFCRALRQTIERLAQEKANLKGVIVTSAKKSFVAGGDLNEMLALVSEEAAQLFAVTEDLKKTFRLLETLGLPVVAAMNGSALGGGYELSLACHHRLLLETSHSRIALPEVNLGLMPGAGGVVRLVRLLGLEKALPILIEGKSFGPTQALEGGLIDGICISLPGMMAQAKHWILSQTQFHQKFDDKNDRIPGGTPKNPGLAEKLAVIPAMLIDKTKGCFAAPEAILSVAVQSLYVDLDTALRIESRAFVKLAKGPTARNMMLAYWSQLKDIKQGKFRGEDTEYPPFKTIGILGAGMMGAGIAFAAAKAGFTVFLKDRDLEAAQKGKGISEKILTERVRKGAVTDQEKTAILSRIVPVGSYEPMDSCDLVIEAVFEDRLVKRDVTEKIANLVSPHAVIASNTSTLPITSLADAVSKKENFIGLHFFSPVDKMQLVEVIKGSKTSRQTVARCFDFVRQIDKIPIVVNDSRGFYTSRVFGTFTAEGMALLAEGQNPAAIERAAVLAGMPVGPLAVSDEVSLVLFELVQKATEQDFREQGLSAPVHPGSVVIQKMLHHFQRKGKAHGAGFYEYPKEGRKYLWPELFHIFKGVEIPFQDIKDRLTFIQALETVRILEENVVQSVPEANLGSIFGFGFVPASGGTLQFINTYGLKQFTNRAWELSRLYGSRFEPPKSLIERCERNELFL